MGNQFLLQAETIVLESSKLYELEEKIRCLLAPCQAEPLIEELRRLRYKPFRDLIDMLPEYIADLAVNQGKEIAPLRITGPEALVDPVHYHDFAQALVHVFRNAVAHGVETPDERLEAGKQPQGRITCHIKEQGANLVITIADDGRGIDDKLIRRVAIARGICSEHAAYGLAEEEAIRLILADGFSSADNANELSGRGVGLAAVKQELDKLGGHLEIMSTVGKGTKFTFILPVMKTGCRLSIKGVTEENGTCACCG
ncbi:ATP-binding protein [Sporomusa acidovorans]|uniref:ATP-binding protein n=1 Tax=Sporomusa acidovorans TaxID=112900 RepID=UPI000B81F987|nr:ATP-binding protein [Sporomusa acidovorans]